MEFIVRFGNHIWERFLDRFYPHRTPKWLDEICATDGDIVPRVKAYIYEHWPNLEDGSVGVIIDDDGKLYIDAVTTYQMRDTPIVVSIKPNLQRPGAWIYEIEGPTTGEIKDFWKEIEADVRRTAEKEE